MNAGSNASPTVQASTAYIVSLNTAITLLNGGGSNELDPPSSTGGTSGNSNAGTKTTSNAGATNNATTKKLYCN